jgi:hypothetical protein
MYTGSLGAVSNREDWIVNISALADDGTSFVFTGAAIVLYVTDEDIPSNAILSGSVADGTIVISADGLTVTWTFTASQMNVLRNGNYSVFVRMTLNSSTVQLISAAVSIVEGGPS